MILGQFKQALCLYVGCLLGSTALHAEECDPAKFLVRDTIHSVTDLRTKIAYVNSMSSQKNDEKNANFANDVYSEFGISNMKVDAATKTSDLLSKLLKVDLSQSDQRWLLVSAIPAGNIDAYKTCISQQKKAIVVTVDKNAAISQAFVLNVSYVAYHPVAAPKVQIKIIVTNGGIDHNNVVSGSYLGEFVAGSSDIYRVVRADMYKPMSIAIKVDTDVLDPQISIPALPSVKIEKFTVSSTPPFAWRLHDTNADFGPKEICAAIPDNQQEAGILPNSTRVVFDERLTDRGVVYDCGQEGQACPDKSSHREVGDRQACVSVWGHLSATTGLSQAKGHVEATALKAVSIPIANPAAPNSTTSLPSEKKKRH
ncbi:hypothetical protein [Bradyrhizobium diazoefficiens]|uniref:hypothetical protein n=1 Tax=Bradyrhizobium diazoefficiens TaxID=1355477 RepID=UPI00348A2CF7